MGQTLQRICDEEKEFYNTEPRRVEAALRPVGGLRPHRLVEALFRQEPRQIELPLAHVVEMLLLAAVLVLAVVVVVMLVMVLPKPRVRPDNRLADPPLARHRRKGRVEVGPAGGVRRGRGRRLVGRLRPWRSAVALSDVHGQEGAGRSAQAVVEVLLPGSLDVE